MIRLHRLRHHRQSGRLARFGQVAQTLFAETLERVGGGAGLEGAAAQHVGPGGFHRPRRLEQRFPAFDDARSADDHRPPAADPHTAHLDDRRSVRAAFTAGEHVRPVLFQDGADARQTRDGNRARDADHGAAMPVVERAGLASRGGRRGQDGVDGRYRRSGVQCDDHRVLLSSRVRLSVRRPRATKNRGLCLGPPALRSGLLGR